MLFYNFPIPNVPGLSVGYNDTNPFEPGLDLNTFDVEL